MSSIGRGPVRAKGQENRCPRVWCRVKKVAGVGVPAMIPMTFQTPVCRREGNSFVGSHVMRIQLLWLPLRSLVQGHRGEFLALLSRGPICPFSQNRLWLPTTPCVHLHGELNQVPVSNSDTFLHSKPSRSPALRASPLGPLPQAPQTQRSQIGLTIFLLQPPYQEVSLSCFPIPANGRGAHFTNA